MQKTDPAFQARPVHPHSGLVPDEPRQAMHEVPEAIRRSLRILPVHRPDAASAVSDVLSVLQREPSTRLSKCLTPHKIM